MIIPVIDRKIPSHFQRCSGKCDSVHLSIYPVSRVIGKIGAFYLVPSVSIPVTDTAYAVITQFFKVTPCINIADRIDCKYSYRVIAAAASLTAECAPGLSIVFCKVRKRTGIVQV